MVEGLRVLRVCYIHYVLGVPNLLVFYTSEICSIPLCTDTFPTTKHTLHSANRLQWKSIIWRSKFICNAANIQVKHSCVLRTQNYIRIALMAYVLYAVLCALCMDMHIWIWQCMCRVCVPVHHAPRYASLCISRFETKIHISRIHRPTSLKVAMINYCRVLANIHYNFVYYASFKAYFHDDYYDY